MMVALDEKWFTFWFGPLQRTTVVSDATEGHLVTDAAGGQIDVCGLCYHLMLCGQPEAMLISVERVAPGGHIDVRGLQCHLKPW